MDNLSNVKHTANTVAIGNKVIGENEPCFIIAEIGINHNGDIDLAKGLIDCLLYTSPSPRD